MDMEIEINRPESHPVKDPVPTGPRRPRLRLDEVVPHRNWNFVQDSPPVAFHRGSSSRGPRWILLAWSAFAAVVDLLICFSLTCFFAYLFVFVSGVSFSAVSRFIQHQFLWGFAGCVLLVFTCYLLTFRVFAGCTIGEWACGIRLGEARQRIANDYSLRVIQRFFLVTVTGIVTLPILSLIVGEDMAGRLSGLPLVQQHFR
ncbi:MAG: RDD family protein [Bdellovibrionaceae bacterium]|nr:RDD family protein [Pseudobdellovibrionaceae bacterium]